MNRSKKGLVVFLFFIFFNFESFLCRYPWKWYSCAIQHNHSRITFKNFKTICDRACKNRACGLRMTVLLECNNIMHFAKSHFTSRNLFHYTVILPNMLAWCSVLSDTCTYYAQNYASTIGQSLFVSFWWL